MGCRSRERRLQWFYFLGECRWRALLMHIRCWLCPLPPAGSLKDRLTQKHHWAMWPLLYTQTRRWMRMFTEIIEIPLINFANPLLGQASTSLSLAPFPSEPCFTSSNWFPIGFPLWNHISLPLFMQNGCPPPARPGCGCSALEA